MKAYKYILLFLCLFSASAHAQKWTTHFAYNDVTQIAISADKVYAISDGSLFSVDKQTEEIRVYDRLSGLHGTGINCIYYDEAGEQLIIAYANGKIDLLSSKGVKYIGELYDKDMTQRKTIYNVTIEGRTAYLATHYGVQTLNLRENKLVDSYWLRPGGEEIAVKDVLLTKDSIYAFTDDSLFCASLKDNLVDYTYWNREIRSGRISPDTDKGTHYKDETSDWYAGQAEGIIRFTPTERLTYKPDGPLINVPYRLTATQGKVWVVPGGAWAVQNSDPGMVMSFDGTKWTNVTNASIVSKTGKAALDFMNVAVDPKDNKHYYVTSYGTGLYEFRDDTLVRREIAGGDNTLGSAAINAERYTRVNIAKYDSAGNLWLLNAGNVDYQLHCVEENNTWHGIPLIIDDELKTLATPNGLVFDSRNANHKWIICGRSAKIGLYFNDNNGTVFDSSDDYTSYRATWTNQHGVAFTPSKINVPMQDQQGNIWLATDIGAAYIDTNTDFLTSEAIVQPDVFDDNGENPFTSLSIEAICQTPDGLIWLGTNNLGVYVYNETADEIVAHYTTDNSVMPNNGILSLACDENGTVWIGTSEGLVSYDQNAAPEGLNGLPNDNNETSIDEGSMMHWRLHLSYNNATQVAASPKYIYAVANGSLFSFDRADESIDYWDKSTGLNGQTITHIAYDKAGYLIIAYIDGRLDILSDDGSIKQMPDISMKAGSMATSINSINVGSRFSYLAMPFGIIVINPRKAEVVDTYYIGEEAAAVNVLQVLEKGDSLYAFTDDRIYSASLNDNLADYSYWHSTTIKVDDLQNAVIYRDKIYTLQHDSLYYLNGTTWQLAVPQKIDWIHVSEGQLLLCIDEHYLYRLTDDHQLVGLSNAYGVNDAVYSQGEYWLGEMSWGLIRLNQDGDDYYHTKGPNNNTGYFMHTAHGQVYSAIGGRWAVENVNFTAVNVFTGSEWIGRDVNHIIIQLGILTLDPVSIAVDNNDPSHFYVATYGTGVIEFKNYNAIKIWTYNNSTLQPVNSTINKDFYTRTDGAMMDENNNLWVLNATRIGQPVHVMSPDGIWHPLRLRSNGSEIALTTPAGIWPDRRNSKYKWLFDQRSSQRVILMDDGGTPTYNGDDKCVARSTFTDQNGNILSPSTFRSFAQDHSNRIWIGTEKGIITIPASVDFFTSDACRRIIIPRNDGSGLGDYLLGEEQINCMAVDGGNRMWIGTASSGLYLIEDDTITVAHFTETNSLLPSNTVLSIAIMPETGEVFVGTDRGIASYRSDASEPQKNLSSAYAYPNPVRPDYTGVISIAGLMENTVVNIVDAGGNLVCKTKSHGGTAVWDGHDAYGRRASAGVYTALCNEPNGGHTVVKILFIR
ncbi:MAG: hypothetical protein K6F10_01795 [Paludibacteraceae bacterium]|nr:hypothetical protein [Paludibacteraceae bacterium]